MSKITSASIRKGKLMEGVVDEILVEIKTGLNGGRNHFDYQYNRIQGGNGRGNKGRTMDSFIVAEFKTSENNGSMPLWIEIKNYGSYPIKSTVFKKKFLEKVRDINKRCKAVGLGRIPIIFIGHFNLSRKQVKKLVKNGVVWFVKGESDLKIDATQENIEQYKMNLRCHLLSVLDVIFPNLLKGMVSNYNLCICDKYNIAITKDGKFFHEIDLRTIKQHNWYYIGPRLMDFIAWSESSEGIVGLAYPLLEYFYDDNKVEIKNIPPERNDRSIVQLEWSSKEAVINVRKP